MHEEIIRYHLDGEISDANLENRKSQLVSFLENQMREDGVIPNLDLHPGFTMDYDHEREVFKFELSVYGIYVGEREDLWRIAGVTTGKILTKHIPQTKSKGF